MKSNMTDQLSVLACITGLLLVAIFAALIAASQAKKSKQDANKNG